MPRVCPWWLGYVLVTPLRRLWQDPHAILSPYVGPGMTVLEPGSGMGFFTLELARLVGPRGRVVVVEVQPRMLAALSRRARRRDLAERIDTRLTQGNGLGVDDLRGKVDFALAFAMVHEVPDARQLLQDLHDSLKPGGRLLIAEPRQHVSEAAFEETLRLAEGFGLQLESEPLIRSSLTAMLVKPT